MSVLKKSEGAAPANPDHTMRTLLIPNVLYYEVIDENTRFKRQGQRRTKEQEIYLLVADGLKWRKLMQVDDPKALASQLEAEERSLLLAEKQPEKRPASQMEAEELDKLKTLIRMR